MCQSGYDAMEYLISQQAGQSRNILVRERGSPKQTVWNAFAVENQISELSLTGTDRDGGDVVELPCCTDSAHWDV